jgi:hypothetical protein
MTRIAFVEDITGPSARIHYDDMVRRLRLHDDPPAGLIVHAAGPTASGWRILAVWESEDDLASFRDERVLPAIADVQELAATSTIEFMPVEICIAPQRD